jgi:hypothetical protein
VSLASAIITAAYRESNLIAIVSTPSTNEITEALARLNSLILSTVGNEAGGELHDITVGGAYDQSQFLSSWIPDNSRLILNLAAARSFFLHPHPYEGQRIAIADAGNNLSTRNLTLTGNGRTIEAASSVVLATNGLARQWLYRGDTGNWVKISSLASSDEMPLPEEFDDYFITMLALRINPRHGAKMSQESMAALTRQRDMIRARYRRPRAQQDLVTGLMGSSGVGAFGSNLLQ